ncbi:MAG: PEP/pyruvate-binding domain-containing protein [Alkalispirochaeta sp.]
MPAVDSTGLTGLDRITDGLHPGDNVVWRISELEDYRVFCRALAQAAVGASTGASTGAAPRLVYFRFAQHEPLFSREEAAARNIEEVLLPLNRGFEHFITTVHHQVVGYGADAVLFFDSLSDLSQPYYSDRMIGNFFQLTCPLILRTGSVAYFSLDRFFHSHHTVGPITETTQILIDVYRYQDRLYVQPAKLDGRDTSPTFTVFAFDPPETFRPVTASGDLVPILNARSWPGLRSASYRMVGVWDRAFLEADRLLLEGASPPVIEQKKNHLLELIISREERILELAREHLTLEDIVAFWKRMEGTGHVGGKAVGMLLANAILRRDTADTADTAGTPDTAAILEAHDSFFVGSDVFYTYLVINNCWWDRQRQKDPNQGLAHNEAARERLLTGEFPHYILERFADMLDYFGTSPVIVRSSSLLEDNFGNAFAGKYDSVFCTMQGSRDERLTELLSAVRHIYAGTISDEALEYRKKRGILDQDEQMALLVQRVSGDRYRDRWFFPHFAGVAFSYNPWAWHRSIDPSSGLVRLVFGLGTRAVDRSDDDYTRVVALNAPNRRPDASPDEVRHHSQRRVDLLDLHEEQLKSVYFADLLKESLPLPLHLAADRDRELASRPGVDPRVAWTLTLDRLLTKTALPEDLRHILQRLRETYHTEVDVEFTVNVDPGQAGRRPYRINIVQCRPLQIRGEQDTPVALPETAEHEVVLRCSTVVGHSRSVPVSRVVYVRPEAFAELPETRRWELAAVIRSITSAWTSPPSEPDSAGVTVLIGPGRWGTSTPALGIPVQVQDIGGAAVLVELDRIHSSLVTDLSLGTHFFNEMVEEDLLYVAYRQAAAMDRFVPDMIERYSNALSTIPEIGTEWQSVVHVADLSLHPWSLTAVSGKQVALLTTT